MLILTRRRGESIIIGNDVELVVLDTGRGQIRLGIAAPETTPIVRSELLKAARHDTPAPVRSPGQASSPSY